MKQMRVVILGSRGYPSTYGGFETFVRRFAPHLVAKGHEVAVYARRDSSKPRKHVVDGICVVQTLGSSRPSLSTLTHGLFAALHAAFIQRPQVALVLNVANGYWLPILRLAGIRVITNVDGIEWERAKWSPTGKLVFRVGATLSRIFSHELIVDSRAIGDYWRRKFHATSKFIAYGADSPAQQPVASLIDAGLTPGEYILAVARLAPENNVDLLLDAAKQFTTPRQVVVVGSSPAPSPLTQRLDAASQQGDVVWLGHVADQDFLAALWQHCAVYVHGHSVGGTNPALLQAMAAGAPVVALDTVFNCEVLGRRDNLYRHDPGTLARLIERVVSDPSYRQALSADGLRTIKERYTWESICADYEAALADLVRSKPPKELRG